MELAGVDQRCTAELDASLVPPVLANARVVCARRWQHGGKHHASRWLPDVGVNFVWDWRQ